ncbi:MAG: hypothetical protein J4F46_04465 [Dehalococcoidia bacterium]|nr:hypothetical protein [Dehalococcoidia bacterium]
MTTMGIREHAQTAREFLQSSEKLWGAFSHAMTAISQDRGWDYGTHRETITAGQRLDDELNDANLQAGVWAARSFHMNFYNGSMEYYEMELGRPIVRAFIERVLGLLAERSSR